MPSPLVMLMQSERALEGRLLDIEKSFDQPRKAPSVRSCSVATVR